MPTHLFDLDGQVAFVTGGSSGLGFMMATALGKNGARVAICGRNEQKLQEARHSLEKENIQCFSLVCDISNKQEVEKSVNRIKEEFGKITILVNNAGRIAEDDPLLLEERHWQKIIDTNLSGAFYCAQAVGKIMVENGGGKIINIASVAGFRGMRRPIKTTAYGVSKGGLILLTKELAVKWADKGVCVNAIAPGIFKTKMTARLIETQTKIIEDLIPAKRVGEEQDLEGVIVFLASPAANYVTGQVIAVDGGQTSW
ncbi:SDR family NAD(P)-dependent oxidoreductase [Neobacillus niacini]|uniref:SDR family NAD(P)-dependent oxidoreductase n=1 Tax=Neobacillus niacini TaxID=86668 RepID=UPI003B01610D